MERGPANKEEELFLNNIKEELANSKAWVTQLTTNGVPVTYEANTGTEASSDSGRDFGAFSL